jgi:hypothetical protein
MFYSQEWKLLSVAMVSGHCVVGTRQISKLFEDFNFLSHLNPFCSIDSLDIFAKQLCLFCQRFAKATSPTLTYNYSRFTNFRIFSNNTTGEFESMAILSTLVCRQMAFSNSHCSHCGHGQLINTVAYC